jgi:hypothetical protein
LAIALWQFQVAFGNFRLLFAILGRCRFPLALGMAGSFGNPGGFAITRSFGNPGGAQRQFASALRMLLAAD